MLLHLHFGSANRSQDLSATPTPILTPHLISLHSWVLGNDPSATAGSIQQYSVKAPHHLGEKGRFIRCVWLPILYHLFPRGKPKHTDVRKGAGELEDTSGVMHRGESHLGELAPIIVADNGVGDSQPVQVAHNTLEPLSIGIIGKDHTCVLHQLG